MDNEDRYRIHIIIEFSEVIMQLRDPYEDGHEKRAAKLAIGLALELKLAPEDIELLTYSAQLHDVGKILIAEHVLNKVKLSTSETNMIRSHADMGERLIAKFRFDPAIERNVRHHHENWDGSGYPDGLKGDVIPLGARILRVVDCFDAMTSERPYREAYTKDEALLEMDKENGTSFDPAIYATFRQMVM
jgi:putative nucleotidyltransferase with HDIG domain